VNEVIPIAGSDGGELPTNRGCGLVLITPVFLSGLTRSLSHVNHWGELTHNHDSWDEPPSSDGRTSSHSYGNHGRSPARCGCSLMQIAIHEHVASFSHMPAL